MCGRYSLTTPEEAIRNLFKITGIYLNLLPRYNIAPSQYAPVITCHDNQRSMSLMRWGLVPSWSSTGPDNKFSMFNARAETIEEKPAFHGALQKRRCLIPVDGFYEWKKEKTGKIPYHIKMMGGTTFTLAGLWEKWRDRNKLNLYTFTIITTEANSFMSDIHKRMPVILNAEQQTMWFDGGKSNHLLRPYSSTDLRANSITSYINNTAHDDPKCLAERAPTKQENRLI